MCHLLTRYQSTIFPNHKSCVRKKGVPEGHLPVFRRDIMGTIVGQHGVVDSVLRQLGVQFARFPVRTRTAVVVDTIRDVRSLLYLRHERSGADSMNTAGRQEKQIARSDGIVAQGIGQRMVCDLPFILRRSELFRKTRFQMRPPDPPPRHTTSPSCRSCHAASEPVRRWGAPESKDPDGRR